MPRKMKSKKDANEPLPGYPISKKCFFSENVFFLRENYCLAGKCSVRDPLWDEVACRVEFGFFSERIVAEIDCFRGFERVH